MSWPHSQDYNEAIQAPAQCFADPELRQGEAATNDLGLPAACSGNFADVYAVSAGRRKWAVKCFTRQIPGLRERYVEVSKYLQQVQLPFMVEFKFLEQGIRVRGQWFPVLKMQWVEGLALNVFVKGHLDDRPVLEALCQIWVKLAQRLREARVGHCDLQHGNVLLVPGTRARALAVKLVDYDGMCVPALDLLKSIELGHPSYQHPQRLREGTYGLPVDRFSHLVIYTALRALAAGGKGLWDKYDNGDNLLFTQADFASPDKSPLFADLGRSDDAQVRRLAGVLAQAASRPIGQVPLLEELVEVPRTAAPSSRIRAAPAATPPPAADQPFAGAWARGGRSRPRHKPGSKAVFWAGLAAGLALLVAGIVFFASHKPAGGPSPMAKAKTHPATPKLTTKSSGDRPGTSSRVTKGNLTTATKTGGDTQDKAGKDSRLPNRTTNATSAPYTLTDIGYFPKDLDSSGATGINSAGHVVVLTHKKIGDAIIDRTLLYDGKSFTDIGTLGGSWAIGWAINDLGHVVGASSMAGKDMQGGAFLYDGKTMKHLGTLGADGGRAVAINNHDQVVGFGYVKNGGAAPSAHAFFFDGTAMKDLGTLGGNTSGARGINDAGLVVGDAAIRGAAQHGFLYDGIEMKDLGTLPLGKWGSSNAWAVNRFGHIVGGSAAADGRWHAFLYRDGKMRDLGSIRGIGSTAHSINSTGQVVGDFHITDAESRAFLYSNGKMVDLNTLIPRDSGWVLIDANGINDKGQIVGAGSFQGKLRAYLLTPVVPPTAPKAKMTINPDTAPPLAIAPFDAKEAQAHQRAWAKHLGTRVETVNSIGMKLVLIPPGKFRMGSPQTEERRSDEEHQHEVEITKAFYLGQYLVTKGDFAAFVKDCTFRKKSDRRPGLSVKPG